MPVQRAQQPGLSRTPELAARRKHLIPGGEAPKLDLDALLRPPDPFAAR
jgi:hypothetical protein